MWNFSERRIAMLKNLIHKTGNGIFMLLVLLFVADPTNTILGLKMPVFALLLMYSLIFFKADWTKIIYFIIPVAAVMLSWVLAQMQGNHVDVESVKELIISFTPLLLLMWAHHYDILRLSIFPVTLAAILVLLLFWTIFFVPETEGFIYNYMCEHGETIMMSNRAILGVKIFCMYPKSTAAFMPVFGWVAYCSLNKDKRTFFSVLATLILLHMFVISGTRSSVMLPVLMLGVLIFIYCRNGRWIRYIIYPGTILFCIAFFALLLMLLMEKSEASNLVKYAHLISYKELFDAHPQYLLLGQGPGTEFYSEGFRRMTLKTEWTYLELLRNYGILCIPILYVILRPVYKLVKMAREHDSALAIAMAYLIYLVIAGTNPLLLSSTGMLVLLSAYSYIACVENKSGNIVL